MAFGSFPVIPLRGTGRKCPDEAPPLKLTTPRGTIAYDGPGRLVLAPRAHAISPTLFGAVKMGSLVKDNGPRGERMALFSTCYQVTDPTPDN